MRNTPYSESAMRRSAWQFLTGMAISALLTFFILIWLVRLLSIVEYGAYVIMVAGMELGFALSSLGLPWIAARYLPEYRLHASSSVLIGLCRQLIIWQVLALLAFIMLASMLLDVYLAWIKLERFLTVAHIFLLIFFIEGLGRFLRDALMGPLMLQGQARLSAILRQFSFLALISVLYFTDYGDLLWVVWAEIVASSLGMIIALFLLWRHLTGLRERMNQSEWSPPTLGEQWHIARKMYAAHLLTQTYSPQVFINLIQRTLGIEASALFGFLRSLQEQIVRYLPASLLFSLIRPKLVAGYVGGGGMVELTRNASLAGKLSLFVLMPLIAGIALVGDPLVAWLSNGKFMDSGWLLFGFTLTLVPFSQRQLIEAVAVISGHAGLCTSAAVSGLIILPFMWIMLQMGLQLWAPVIAIGLGYVLFNEIVVAGMSRQKNYRANCSGFLKLVMSVMVAYGVNMLLHMEGSAIWISPQLPIVLQCLLVVTVYLMLTWWIKPFAADERRRINSLIKCRAFVW